MTPAEDASGQLPTRAPRNPLSRRRIEIIISRCVAAFGLIFAAPALVPVLEQSRGMPPLWNVVAIVSIFGGLTASLVLSLLNRGVRAINGFITLAWFAATVTWPFAIVDVGVLTGVQPWIFYLLTVATATAAVALPSWAATVTLVILAATWGVVRASPGGGDLRADFAMLQSVYALLLGGAVVVLITLLRQAAAAVDLAQTTAIDRYSNAVREHATEVERVQVDAIVHDSVLTTFLSAARAETPAAKQLAGQMAENAMGHLRSAATSTPDAAGSIPAQKLADDIRAAASGIPASIDVRRGPALQGELPGTSAEAVYAAAVQAMVNSAQHAGTGSAVRRWLIVRPAPGGIEVVVGDDGKGFDPAVLSRERIGVRVSIVERTVNAGGAVEIDSAPDVGTTVRIRWPAPRETQVLPGPVDVATADGGAR